MTTNGVSFGRAVQLKARMDPDTWQVQGYVSTFGNTDLAGDVVVRGAYQQTLADGHPIRLLFAHDQTKILGKPLELHEDDHGLHGTFLISKTELGRDVRQLLLDQALDSFSVGFIARDWSTDQRTGIRELKTIDLLECSIVALPANTQALVTAAKARRAPRDPLVSQLEVLVGRLRHHAFVAGMTDAEARGYARLLRSRLPGANSTLASNSGGR